MHNQNYRHKFALYPDLSLSRPLELYASDGVLTNKMVTQIDDLKRSHDLKQFDISYDYSGGYIYIGFDGKSKIEDFASTVMIILNFCVKLEIYISNSTPYYMSWGDYESGAIYFHTDKDTENNKAIITGISNNGDIVVNTIPWKY